MAIFRAHDWEEDRLKGASDEEVILAAAEADLALVTYDVNTIPLLLIHLANEGLTHSGITFVNNAAIRSNDYGGLVRALIQLYDAEKEADWQDRIFYLSPTR